jgi:hypothetical protein
MSSTSRKNADAPVVIYQNVKSYIDKDDHMSMHLVGPYLTTTNYTKRKTKVTQGKMNQWLEEYRVRCKLNKRLKLPIVSFEEFIDEVHGRVKRTKTFKSSAAKNDATIENIREHREKYPSLGMENISPDSCAKRENMQYTGTLIKGIATMHKSNAVPIINNEQAMEISRMRRG